jgi:ActR/RegA family two-component response regulator
MAEEKKELRVLLIEDDPDDVLLLTERLRSSAQARFSLECALSLKDGIAFHRSCRFDAVLLDLTLPDGHGLGNFLMVHAERPDVPVIVLTGLKDEEVALEAVRHGAQDYLFKDELDAAILRRSILYSIERDRLRARMEGLIESAPYGMAVVDGRGMVRYLNAEAERLLGREAETMLGYPFPYPAEAGSRQELQLGEGADGLHAELRAVAIDWKGEPAILVSMHDTTELKRTEWLKSELRERQRRDRLKDALLGTVSLELRSPLANALAALDNLAEGLAGPISFAQAGLIATARRNLHRAADELKRLLDIPAEGPEAASEPSERSRPDPEKAAEPKPSKES